MKKEKTKTPPERWMVARSIYNNSDYEVWAICSSEKECKEWISNYISSIDRKDFFYFQKN